MNRQLSNDELELARSILLKVRMLIKEASAGKPELLWALRRKICKELGFDERGKPMVRRALKNKLFKKQNGKCQICRELLPPKGAVLDRQEAMKGYTEANVNLICPSCDAKKQEALGYK